MNEIERAINLISGGEIDYSGIYDCELNERVTEVALTALREKAERSKGCEYCQSENGQGTDIWHGNQLSVGYGVYRAIKFCPMCGKAVGNEAIR
jgi:hypothetical protein